VLRAEGKNVAGLDRMKLESERNEVERAARMGGSRGALPDGREGRVPFPISEWAHLGSNQERPRYERGTLTN
jgi:hypothetical protein